MLYNPNKVLKYLFRRISPAIFVFLVLFVLYISFSTNAHLSYAQDALEFSHWIENGFITKINRHFLWNIVFFYFYKIWNIIGLSGGALKAGQVLSSFFGAGGVILFYHILRKLSVTKKDYLLNSIFTGFYAFSFAYWHFSGEANPHVFSNFLRLFLLLLIIRKKEAISFKISFLYGIFFGLVFISEILGLGLLVSYGIIIYFFTKKSKIFNAAIFCFTSIIASYVFYGILASSLIGVRIQDIIPSIFSSAPNTTDFFREFPLGGLYLFLTVVFIPGVRTPSLGNPEIIMLKNVLTPFNLIFFSFLCLSVIIGIKYSKRFSYDKKAIAYACFSWFVILFGYQIYREPRALDNLFYILPALWILMFIAWQNFSDESTTVKLKITKISLIVILLFYTFHNFVFGILPNSKDSGYELIDYYYYIKNNTATEDRLILIGNLGNFELCEIDYLLKYKSALNIPVILLDGYRHRSFHKDDVIRYENYKTLMKNTTNGNLYVFIIPKLSSFLDFKQTGDIEKLRDIMKEFFFSTKSIHAKYSLEIIKEISDIYDTYVVVENKNLDCTLLRLVRLKD